MKEKIAKAKKYVNIVDKARITLLCLALPMLLFIYFGEKLWGELAWYVNTAKFMYGALSYLVLGIVVVTFGKYFLIAYHNSLVKKL
jgi:hypothetical protein